MGHTLWCIVELKEALWDPSFEELRMAACQDEEVVADIEVVATVAASAGVIAFEKEVVFAVRDILTAHNHVNRRSSWIVVGDSHSPVDAQEEVSRRIRKVVKS